MIDDMRMTIRALPLLLCCAAAGLAQTAGTSPRAAVLQPMAVPSTLDLVYQIGQTPYSRQVYISGSGPIQFQSFQGPVDPIYSFDSTAPGFVTILVDPIFMAAGNYTMQATFLVNNIPVVLTVNQLVTAAPVLHGIDDPVVVVWNQYSPIAVVSDDIQVLSSDFAAVKFTAAVDNPSATPWLKITNSTGTTPGKISVTISPPSNYNGVFLGSITVTSPDGNNPYVIPVAAMVRGATGATDPPGYLTLSSQSVSFTLPYGGNPVSQILQVSAPSPTPFTVETISTSKYQSPDWLTVSKTSATTPAMLTLTADQGELGIGTTTDQLFFTVNGYSQIVNVSATVPDVNQNGGAVVVTAAGGGSNPSLAFTAAKGTQPASQTLTVTNAAGPASLVFSVLVTKGAWARIAREAGITPAAVSVGADTTGLDVGSYPGEVMVIPAGSPGPGTVTVPMTLNIAPSLNPAISASGGDSALSYQMGGTVPDAGTIHVSVQNAGSGGFTTTVTSTGWLTVSPATGTAPADLTVSVNPGSLTPGVYAGSILINGTNGATGSSTIIFILTVTPQLPTVKTVVNSASFGGGAISPGELVTILGAGLGPVAPASLALDASGRVSTNIGGVQVLVGGYASPLIYASATQVNAIVPYEAAGLLNANVLVQYLGQSSNGFAVPIAPTAPGIFTATSTGFGQGAVLNGDNSYNSASNPAARGSIVQLFLTGEGQTTPPGVTGRVNNVTSAAQLPSPSLPVTVLVGGQPATLVFAGEAPGLVSGVMQIDFQIPASLLLPASAAEMDAAITVFIGGAASRSGVTVAVKLAQETIGQQARRR